MNFRFRKTLDKAETLLLRTEDPQLFRIGALEEYPDVDRKKLEELVYETVEQELCRMRRIRRMLDTDEFRKKREDLLEDLRLEARELFEGMCDASDEELLNLNDSFSDVMKRKRNIETAFSRRNPWLRHYWNLKGEDKGVGGIIVHATILDKSWFEHPAYPVIKGYCKSLMKARVCDSDAPYIEPKLQILSYEPIIPFSDMRDLLPVEWLDDPA